MPLGKGFDVKGVTLRNVLQIRETLDSLMGIMGGQPLNNNSELNVALGLTHLQYNAQHEKNPNYFYCICIMINVASIFFTQLFQRKKCDVVVEILPSTQKSRV
jgi:hypothetical protein